MEDLKRFFVEEEAMGTIEVVLIAAVLISLALLFKGKAVDFVKYQMDELDKATVTFP